MIEPEFVIPADRLPPGFARLVEQPVTQPADPKPAATVVLLRDGHKGMEALLLKRHRSSGFVPGAYVFPGGRTDPADGDAKLRDHALHWHESDVPAPYWFAAVREVFEETGVLIARAANGDWVPDTTQEPAIEKLRLALMDDHATLRGVIERCNCRLDFANLVYFAHWITPLAEPRRYDTRFVAAVLPDNRTVRADAREMTDAVWLRPAAALERFAAGTLPMVFPTVRTLEQLAGFPSTDEALRELRTRDVEAVLPRLVRTESGVGIVIDPK